MIEGDCLSFRISVYLFIPSVRKDDCIQYSLPTPTNLLGAICKMFLLTIKKAPPSWTVGAPVFT